MASMMDNIKAKIDQFKGGKSNSVMDRIRGKSGYGIGFSGAGPSIADKIKGVTNVVKTKGVIGTVQSAAKGEKPIMKQINPGSSGAGFMQRLPAYKAAGRTEIRSRGN
jgi:hypothetical protein